MIVASLVATLYLSAMIMAAAALDHRIPSRTSLIARHPHFVSNSRPMKHLPHPNPWMIRATGWVVSVVSQLS